MGIMNVQVIIAIVVLLVLLLCNAFYNLIRINESSTSVGDVRKTVNLRQNSLIHRINNNNNNGNSKTYPAVISPPISRFDRIQTVGGFGHWFHVFESSLSNVGRAWDSVCSSGNNNHQHPPSDRLYILFREESSISQMNAFTRLLLASIFSCGVFPTVVFGTVTGHNNIIGNNNIDSSKVHESFVIQLNNNNNNSSSSKYSSSIARNSNDDYFFIDTRMEIDWKTIHKPRHDTFNENRTHSFHRLRNSINKMCFGNSNSNVQADSKEQIILIYQRNQGRKLLNINALQDSLSHSINTWNSQGEASVRWKLKTIIHSNDRQPCDVISDIQQSTILITPHGFQAILHVFQPLTSSLIEIFPAYYPKFNLYGDLQYSIKHHQHSKREYLGIVSSPTVWYISMFEKLGITANTCLHSAPCRYFSRQQDVLISPHDIHRITQFIQNNSIT